MNLFNSGFGLGLIAVVPFRGFPVDKYRGDRVGLVLAFWGVALALGRIQVSQTDYTERGTTFGSVLNHVTVGRKTHGAHAWPESRNC